MNYYHGVGHPPSPFSGCMLKIGMNEGDIPLPTRFKLFGFLRNHLLVTRPQNIEK